MNKQFRLGLAVMAAVCALAGLAPSAVAQVVPDTVDPYELAPQGVHLYPVSLNARNPYFYIPPIFAPAPMWRGALTAEDVYAFAPHNYVAYEIPESTALVAWGTVKGDETVTLEAANQQEFIIVAPESLRNEDNSFFLFRTEMRYVPRCMDYALDELLERELILEPSPRVQSITAELPVDVLLKNYDRVEDVADLQPRLHEELEKLLALDTWPVDRIYINYSGWRRNPNRIRTLGEFIPEWFTIEGKLLALKRFMGGNYLISISFEGYQPWYPIETSKNVMRKLLALSFDDFVETEAYYNFEKPLNGKEWMRQGSGMMYPYDTRMHVGTGSPGQGSY